jgi:hypothetical protein
MSMIPKVEGFCRHCGHPTLILNKASRVVCTHPFCKDPWASDRMLNAEIPKQILPHAQDMPGTFPREQKRCSTVNPMSQEQCLLVEGHAGAHKDSFSP